MYLHVCVCMPAIAERLRPAYPALPERAGVGSIPVEYVVSLLHSGQTAADSSRGPHCHHSTIPRSMHGHKDSACFRTTAPFPEACTATRPKDACYKLGVCDSQGAPGSGSPLLYINTWAMVWPNDYPALAT